ncbi:MAG TPA: helix-turn-helix domain-containing protein [Marmoricola sp.]|nr:helix-turn-helix domain-containing protein [Marmoricola sp.]
MQLRAEFTTEPFQAEGETPAHATEPVRVLQQAGFEVDFGPLGTGVSGESEPLLDALRDVLGAALANGATRVTLQVRLPEVAASPGTEATGLGRLLADVAAELGGPLDRLPRADKQRAVRLLEERGAFDYRRSAETVAEALGVTRFTVYNYLNRTS